MTTPEPLPDDASLLGPDADLDGVAPRLRATEIAQLRSGTFDVLVVGGGITGAGVARDAVTRGLRVALVERADYASGTSSRSSKLIHGGLRYLENLEFGLVFEALRERALLRKLNPHLVWPLPFVFPVYRRDRHSLFKINLGLWLYDLLSAFRTYRWHERLSARGTADAVKGLLGEGLTGSVRYHDCRTDDARLTLATVLAARREGAVCLNYLTYDETLFDTDGARVSGARVTDRLTGESFPVRCKHVVRAAGPWTDDMPDRPGDEPLLRPTKGVHLVVPRERLPLDACVVMTAVQDGRVVFAEPCLNTTFVGTTDTDFRGDIDQIRATSDDVAYLLETTNHYFPDAHLEASDVRSTWAGLRPLVRDDSSSPGKTSREHQIYEDPRGLTTVAGGKLTTYRKMAREAVDIATGWLLATHGTRSSRCVTADLPLDPDVPRYDDPMGPADELEQHLWRHHGSGMTWVRERSRVRPAEAQLLLPDLPYVLAEVTRAVVMEQAQTVEDVLVRRSHVHYRAADQGLSCARLVAERMGALLSRDSAWIDGQVDAYEAAVARSRLGAQALVSLQAPQASTGAGPAVADAAAAAPPGLAVGGPQLDLAASP